MTWIALIASSQQSLPGPADRYQRHAHMRCVLSHASSIHRSLRVQTRSTVRLMCLTTCTWCMSRRPIPTAMTSSRKPGLSTASPPTLCLYTTWRWTRTCRPCSCRLLSLTTTSTFAQAHALPIWCLISYQGVTTHVPWVVHALLGLEATLGRYVSVSCIGDAGTVVGGATSNNLHEILSHTDADALSKLRPFFSSAEPATTTPCHLVLFDRRADWVRLMP